MSSVSGYAEVFPSSLKQRIVLRMFVSVNCDRVFVSERFAGFDAVDLIGVGGAENKTHENDRYGECGKYLPVFEQLTIHSHMLRYL